jgi:ferredoxin/flavodoxin---NADP+ reductase
MDFAPGQHIAVGICGSIDMREYSIYSAGPDYLEILVKVVEGGAVSRALAELKPGDPVTVDGPFGYFTVDPEWRSNRYRFIATGTGISPFRMITEAYPGIDYTLLHGTRYTGETIDPDRFDPPRLVRCVSREAGGDFHGRVTDYLRAEGTDPDARYYLCGNCDMIYEVFDILQDGGVPHSHIFAEVYF